MAKLIADKVSPCIGASGFSTADIDRLEQRAGELKAKFDFPEDANHPYIEAATQLANEARTHKENILSVLQGEDAKRSAPMPATAAGEQPKFGSVPELADSVAKENGLSQQHADAYTQAQHLGRSQSKVAADMGVGKSTVGDMVRKMNPLMETAKRDRLEAGHDAARPDPQAPEAAHDSAPVTEPAPALDEPARHPVDGLDEAGEDDRGEAAPTELSHTGDMVDEDNAGQGQEHRTEDEFGQLNVSDSPHGEGKTSADNNIDKARSATLKKRWDTHSDALPAEQRVKWDDLGSAQQDTFDQTVRGGSAKRIAEAHRQLTELANQGTRYSRAEPPSAAEARRVVDEAGKFSAVKDAKPTDVRLDGEHTHLSALDVGNGSAVARAIVNLTQHALDGVGFFKHAMQQVDAFHLFHTADATTELGRSDAIYSADGNYIAVNGRGTLHPNLESVVVHELTHAADAAANKAIAGSTGYYASEHPQSRTMLAPKISPEGKIVMNAGSVAGEVLTFRRETRRDMRAGTATPEQEALLHALEYPMGDLVNSVNEIHSADPGMREDVARELAVSLNAAISHFASELTPVLAQLRYEHSAALAEHMPEAYAHVGRLWDAKSSHEVAAALLEKDSNARLQRRPADAAGGAARQAGEPVPGQVRGDAAGGEGRYSRSAVPADSGRADERQARSSADAAESRANARLRDIPPPILEGSKGVGQWVKNILTEKASWRSMPGLLGFASTEQLAERFHDMPAIKKFSDTMRDMGALGARIKVASDAPMRAWRELHNKNGDVVNTRFSQMLMDASRLTAWPMEELGVGRNKHLPTDDAEINAAHKKLQAEWRVTPPAYRKLFESVVADGQARRNAEIAGTRKSVVRGFYPDPGSGTALTRDVIDKAAGLSKSERAAFLQDGQFSPPEIKTVSEMFGNLDSHDKDLKQLPGPYFPDKRFGDHVVSYKSSGFIDAESKLKDASAALQHHLSTDEYRPVADADMAIKKLKTRLDRATLSDSRADLEKQLAAAKEERDLVGAPVDAARELVNTRQEQLNDMKAEGQHYGVEFYEDRALAQVNQQRLETHFGPDSGYEVKRDLKAQYLRSLDGVTPEFMRRIEAKMATGLPAADAQKVKDSMREVYIRMQPENSALKSSLKRMNVMGARPEEAQRAFATSAIRGAHSISRLEYGNALHQHVNDLRFARGDEDSVLIGNELVKRIAQNAIHNETPILDTLTNMTSLTNLGLSPGFLMMHGSQPMVVGAPVMAGRHGMRESVKQFAVGAVDAAKILKVSFNKDRRMGFQLDPSEGVKAGIISKGEGDMLKGLLDSGRIDVSITHDLGMAAGGDDSSVMSVASRIANYPVHQLDMINRVTAGLAGYRAEMKRTGDHAASAAYADKLIHDTLLNYSGNNRARLMHSNTFGGYGKVVFQYRTFQQGMLYLMYKNLVDGFGAKKDPDARRAVAYLAGSQMAVAGLKGMPIHGATAAVSALLYKSFTPADDQKDLKQMLHNGLASVLGERGAVAMTNGIPAAFGIDVSDKLGLGHIGSIAPFVDDNKVGKDMIGEYFDALAGGATLGLLKNYAQAAVVASQGDWVKASTLITPKVVADLTRAVDYQARGMRDGRGNTTMEAANIPVLDSITKAVGFQPTNIELMQDRRGAMFQAKQNRDTVRKTMLLEFAHQRINGGDVQAVRDRIQAFNERHWDDRITGGEMEKAVVANRRALQDMRDGVRIGKHDKVLANSVLGAKT